eukprot:jgi/Mesvir1/16497/Mv10050-RA.1
MACTVGTTHSLSAAVGQIPRARNIIRASDRAGNATHDRASVRRDCCHAQRNVSFSKPRVLTRLPCQRHSLVIEYARNRVRTGTRAVVESSVVDIEGSTTSREPSGRPDVTIAETFNNGRLPTSAVPVLDVHSHAAAGDVGPSGSGNTKEGTSLSSSVREGPPENGAAKPADGKWSKVLGGAAPASEYNGVVAAAWESLMRWGRFMSRQGEGNALDATKKMVIFGGGSFGTAIATLLARNKPDMDVVILMRNQEVADDININHKNSRYFPSSELPHNVRATTDAAEALDGAQYVVHSVPVQASRKFLQSIAHLVPPTLPILSVSKGLESSTALMMTDVIKEGLNNKRQPIAILSGPTFASELMQKLPTAIVTASKDPALGKSVQELFASQYLRVNTSTDVIGVEMAGALKNVLAIAAGMVEGMNLGNNAIAALVAQGCSEIRWLAVKVGGAWIYASPTMTRIQYCRVYMYIWVQTC